MIIDLATWTMSLIGHCRVIAESLPGHVVDGSWIGHGSVMDRSWIGHGSVMDRSWIGHGSVNAGEATDRLLFL